MLKTKKHGLAVGALLFGAAIMPVFAQTPPNDLSKSGLVGELEGITIVSDTAKFPTQFKQAPLLDNQVKTGKLPPVEQRLPKDVLVIQPIHELGKYGGTWRRGFTGPGDSENGNRIMFGDKPLFFDKEGSGVVANLIRGYDLTPDGKKTTLHLRRGLRWSDGSPFNANDFEFWFNDVYGNKDLVPSRASELTIAGKPGRFIKIDEATIAYEFDEPFFLFPRLLAGDTLVGGGQSHMQSDGLSYGLYAPAQYLKQFLPKNSSVEELNTKAKAAGFDSWTQLFKFKSDWRLNTELPVAGAWKTTQPINTQLWVLERNPFYYAVDTAGNQLPYIDKIQMSLAENAEVINLRAITGAYDYQERFVDLNKLPVLLENQEKGGYKVRLDMGFNGSDSMLFANPTYQEDKEIGKWLATPDFRRAISLGIDRNQLNQAFFLGLGTAGSAEPSAALPESPGDEYRNKWSTLDIAKSNSMLDAIGLSKKDAEGFRLRTDNGQRLRIEILVSQTLSPTWPQQAEMIVQQWRKIGIAGDVRVLERSLADSRLRGDLHQLFMWMNIGTDQMFLQPRYVLPMEPGFGAISASISRWYTSGGTTGTKPSEPEMLKALDIFKAATQLSDTDRVKSAQEIWKLFVEQQWGIGLVGQSPAILGVRVVNTKLGNIPARTCISQHCRTPGGAHPEQWYFR